MVFSKPDELKNLKTHLNVKKCRPKIWPLADNFCKNVKNTSQKCILLYNL